MANTTQILKGLEIIEKYEPSTEFSAAEGQIWAGCENLIYKMTEGEVREMIDLGWRIDELFGSWTHYC